MTAKLRIKTFGGLGIVQDRGPQERAAGQRRPLAVLAMLVAAGDLGISRDKLTSVLWPDVDAERGRRALAQTLYSLRKSAGDPELIEGVADVRLNRASIEADALSFDDAIRNGRLEEAAQLYQGPFCDGFSVPGAPEFDIWLDRERMRYASRHVDVLRRLVRQAQSEKNLESEIEYCRQLVAIDPLDSTSTVMLMDALAKAGDIAGALRCGTSHAEKVASELEMPASGPVVERIASLKALRLPTPAATPAANLPVANPRDESRISATVEPATVEPASPNPQPDHQRPLHRRRSLRTASLIAGAAIAVLLIFSFLFIRRNRPVAVAEAASTLRGNVIAIMPFVVESTDRSLDFLSEGSADLFAGMLTGDGGPRAVDPGAVLALLDSLPLTPGSSPQAFSNRARTVSQKLGAGKALIGQISGTAQEISINATLLDVTTDKKQATAQVSGPADSLASLVEVLATRLIAQSTIGSDRASAFQGARLSLLRSYLRAESAYHGDNYAEAVAGYKQALALDSTFAPAALGLALAADRLNAAEQHDHGLALAWAAKDRLSERDRSYLIALAGPRYPEPSPIREQLSAWENVVALNPDRSSGWTELGERMLYDGSLLGITDSDVRASAAFRRAMELDPDDERPRRYLIQIASKSRDIATIDRLLRGHDLQDIGGEIGWYLTWRVAIARNDTAGLKTIRQRFPSFGTPSLRAIAMASQYEGVGVQDGARALRLLRARAVLGEDQLDVLLAEHSLALNQGRPLLALDLTERLQDAQPGTRAHLRLRVLDALYARGDSAAAFRAVGELEQAVLRKPGDAYSQALRLADLCVLAQWQAAPWRQRPPISEMEMARLRLFIRELRNARLPWPTVPVGASPRACGEIVEAMLAVRGRTRSAHARVAGLDDVMLTGPAVGDATAWATLATARLYEILGDKQRALIVVRQRPFMKGWPRYLGASLMEEAKLSRMLGDTRGDTAAVKQYQTLTGESIR